VGGNELRIEIDRPIQGLSRFAQASLFQSR